MDSKPQPLPGNTALLAAKLRTMKLPALHKAYQQEVKTSCRLHVVKRTWGRISTLERAKALKGKK